MRDLGDELGREAAKWFGVPASDLPRRLHHHHRPPPPPEHHHHHHHAGSPPAVMKPGGGGPLVNIETLNIHHDADMHILEHRINFAVIAAGFGG